MFKAEGTHKWHPPCLAGIGEWAQHHIFQVLGIFLTCPAVTGLRDALVDVSGNPDINSQSVGAGARERWKGRKGDLNRVLQCAT